MIRLADARDARLLASLHASSFPEDAWPALGFMTLLADPGTDGLLAEDPEAGAAGFALLRSAAGESEVLTIGVLPGLRRLGYGGRLLDAMIVLASRRGSDALFLEVAEDNAAAIRLYIDRGFLQVGRRPGYYRRRSGVIAALVLRRNIAPADGRP